MPTNVKTSHITSATKKSAAARVPYPRRLKYAVGSCFLSAAEDTALRLLWQRKRQIIPEYGTRGASTRGAVDQQTCLKLQCLTSIQYILLFSKMLILHYAKVVFICVMCMFRNFSVLLFLCRRKNIDFELVQTSSNALVGALRYSGIWVEHNVFNSMVSQHTLGVMCCYHACPKTMVFRTCQQRVSQNQWVLSPSRQELLKPKVLQNQFGNIVLTPVVFNTS